MNVFCGLCKITGSPKKPFLCISKYICVTYSLSETRLPIYQTLVLPNQLALSTALESSQVILCQIGVSTRTKENASSCLNQGFNAFSFFTASPLQRGWRWKSTPKPVYFVLFFFPDLVLGNIILLPCHFIQLHIFLLESYMHKMLSFTDNYLKVERES